MVISNSVTVESILLLFKGGLSVSTPYYYLLRPPAIAAARSIAIGLSSLQCAQNQHYRGLRWPIKCKYLGSWPNFAGVANGTAFALPHCRKLGHGKPPARLRAKFAMYHCWLVKLCNFTLTNLWNNIGQIWNLVHVCILCAVKLGLWVWKFPVKKFMQIFSNISRNFPRKILNSLSF